MRVPFGVVNKTFLVTLVAALVSLGVSGLNEIMEFLITVNLERNVVGGYDNAMIDLCFNWGGAVIAVVAYALIEYQGRTVDRDSQLRL